MLAITPHKIEHLRLATKVADRRHDFSRVVSFCEHIEKLSSVPKAADRQGDSPVGQALWNCHALVIFLYSEFISEQPNLTT
jgi:hypothetical protein